MENEIKQIQKKIENDFKIMFAPEEDEKAECHHVCISNCRREGCNCECGEFHE